jgi:phospholipid-translocating ATPase
MKLDVNPTLADVVRIKQKYGRLKSKSKTNFFATRPRSSIHASSRSFKRSGYAFSHEEGFGDLIRDGKMMPEPSVSFILIYFGKRF